MQPAFPPAVHVRQPLAYLKISVNLKRVDGIGNRMTGRVDQPSDFSDKRINTLSSGLYYNGLFG